MTISDFSMKNKVALVTGAAAGIGACTVEALASAGAKVYATDLQAFGDNLKAKWSDKGYEIEYGQQDVADEQLWAETTDRCIERFGGLDVVVNNAGIYQGGMLVNNSLEQMRRVHKINVESIFLGMKYPAIAMQPGGKAGNGGSIINLSSLAGLVGVPGHTAYGSSKGAVRLYTKHAAVEFAQLGYGIRVNSVHPGVIDTSMGGQVFKDFAEGGLMPDEQAAQEFAKQITPMGRLGMPEEVANMILFLASDASSFVTGSEFVVDGGVSAQ